MNFYKSLLTTVGAACISLSSFATPITYSDAFPTSGATVIGSVGMIDADEIGYFWSMARGDSVTQSYAGTGLDSVSQLDLTVDVTRNVLSEDLLFVGIVIQVCNTAHT